MTPGCKNPTPLFVDMIGISDLEVTYGSTGNLMHALRGISLYVKEGESFGLVGESGSGKSTVLRAICGLAPACAGTVQIDGKALVIPRPKSFYRKVQMVFQDPYASLHPRHTIDRVLSEPLAIHDLENPEQRICQALDEVGLGTGFRFRYPHQLSGGQRQRVAIARALIVEPTILLLDEPTSALDASIQAEVLNLLDRIRSERHLTYLLVSHDLAVVSHMCDRLVVMQQGLVVEQMTQQALVTRQTEQPYTQRLMNASMGFTRLQQRAVK